MWRGCAAEGRFDEDTILACLAAFVTRVFGDIGAFVEMVPGLRPGDARVPRVRMNELVSRHTNAAVKALLSQMQHSQLLEAYAMTHTQALQRRGSFSSLPTVDTSNLPAACETAFRQSGYKATFGASQDAAHGVVAWRVL